MHGVLLAQVHPTMVNYLASITCAFTKVLHALNVEYKLIQKLVVLLSTQCIYYRIPGVLSIHLLPTCSVLRNSGGIRITNA